MSEDTYDAGRLTRRRFALAGGAAAAGALATFSARTEASAAIEGGRFDLAVPSTQLLREKTPHNGTVLQSFAFDDTNKHLYVIQLMEGGIQLDGEPGPVSGADRAARGDMCVTKMSLAGAELGSMYVKGFGHGVAIGCEPVGGTAYLWTESDADPASGYGRAISRFRFAAGTVLASGSSSLVEHRPVPGSTGNQPAVDMLNKRLMLRYRLNGVPRYRLMRLADVTAGKYPAVYDIPQVGVAANETFQGFAVLGDYVYQLTGTAYTDEGGTNPPSGHGNTYVSCIDLRSGELVQRARTEAGYSLDYREPEGMAIQLTSPRRLCMGFASGASGDRKASVYYKSQ
ncbi:teichoic acid biosynthesis protein C [Streptomyces sp. NA02950]|uniref:phage baseplate protein n=1 Tax=Streptomyces sp. NA02950 TaxID=2742137 RepID=UPI0015920CCE|nr:teichoic acid biosynthesis protein C [Streptomyces sp. NA02950]QKV94705.1 teichoic acid biosynthesis protein C [Streptomyces sp. NA02950]